MSVSGRVVVSLMIVVVVVVGVVMGFAILLDDSGYYVR